MAGSPRSTNPPARGGCRALGAAGGVAGSVYAARLIDEGNLIPFDMGGTSTDISLIVDGRPSFGRRPPRRGSHDRA